MIAVPSLFVCAAVGLLVYAHDRDVSGLAVMLAAATVLMATARMLVTFRDVRTLAETRRLAHTDDLTSMPNRRLFMRRAGDAIAAARLDRSARRPAADRPRPLQGAQRHARLITPETSCWARSGRACAPSCARPTTSAAREGHVEDVVEDERGPLRGRELLEQHQQRVADRLVERHAIGRVRRRRGDHGLRQPRADVGLASHAGRAQRVEREPATTVVSHATRSLIDSGARSHEAEPRLRVDELRVAHGASWL